MKLTRLQALSNDELNIRIAKLCGYNYPNKEHACNYPTMMCPPGSLTYERLAEFIPDYASNLNDMHRAVEAMVKRHGMAWYIRFDNALAIVVGHHDHMESEMIHSTARQRAMAFALAEEGK